MESKLQQIKDEYAKEKGYVDYSHAFSEIDDEDFDEIARRYVRECCKASLEKAADECGIAVDNIGRIITDRESITKEENITIL